jgi:3-isopropylmalate/(R)-2-methylmalate dehydratase large subunit
MTRITLSGRILFLSNDPDKLDAQLRGQDFTRNEAGVLRDDVSTDEITPIPALSYYDERLGRYPYTGLKTGDRRPFGTDSVLNGGFCVVVAGKRYGKGSSREHSPIAERAAGIRLVIAESFERIYRQNADNVGLLTSTDFGLIERIRRGDPIYIDELVQSRDSLAASILKCNGLLRYGQLRMANHQATLPLSSVAESGGAPQTFFEKILARHAVRTEETSADLKIGSGGFVRADWRFIHEYYTGMCMHGLHEAFGQPIALHEPERIVAFEDHLSYMHRSQIHLDNGLIPNLRGLSQAHREFVRDYAIQAHGYLAEEEGSEGISHALMTEKYAMPGQLVVGTDSHTPHSGAVGCLAFGVGTTDMANSMVTGAVRLTVPESLRIVLDGKLSRGVTAKDLVLHLLAHPKIKAGAGVGKAFEFSGPALAELSTDERATLCNMTAEMGGFSGLIIPDAETVRFLRERRGIEVRLEPWMCSDEGARYADTIRFDCDLITPMAAAPGDPGNGVALRDLPQRVRVDIAYGGSCTAGKREDFDAYHEVLSWAVKRGLSVSPHTRLYLQFGTVDVREYCRTRNYLSVFEQAGVEVLQPACGACANCGPGASITGDQITVSAINRNFPGRSGPGQVWLASPPTVAASAIAGELMSFEELRRIHASAELCVANPRARPPLGS